MKSTSTIFLAAFIAASASWAGFVLAPQIQLGDLAQSKPTGSDTLYPTARPGLAAQGAEVYRSLGCVHCHTQQVRQEGAYCEVVLTKLGTNLPSVQAVLAKFGTSSSKESPQLGVIARVADVPAGEPLKAALKKAGATAELHTIATGTDIARGWGFRQSIAQDYLYDQPVQLGARRNGPDLSNIGAGKPSDWQLVHLFQPKAVVKDSTMPPYPFLFQIRKQGAARSPEALNLPAGFAPASDMEVVPTEAGRALVAYLASLRKDAPFFEAPFTLAQTGTEVSTNSAAK